MTSLPRGLRWLVRNRLEYFDDQVEGFMDFEQRLDWDFRMTGHEGKRQSAEGTDSRLVINSLGQYHDKR
jgi:hypothetical protein